MQIVFAPDGNMWFAENRTNRIGRITPAGAITEFRVSGAPNDITVGKDGSIWFTQGDNALTAGIVEPSRIVRMTLTGETTQYPVDGLPFGIASGRGIWFTLLNNQVGRLVWPPRRRTARR